jgi:uncharacterized protein YjbJ (UPF0337 family)
MKPTNALMKARWHQTRGAVKATWGKISKRNRTRLEGQMEQLSGRSQERLLLTEAQARREIGYATRRGQQNIQQLSAALVATATQALGRPAARRSSRSWIPVLGGAALLASLGVAVLTHQTGVFAAQHPAKSGGASY